MNWVRGLAVALSFAVVAVVSLSGGISSAAFDPYNTGWDGTSGVQAALEGAGTETYASLDTGVYREVPANGTAALVLSPDAHYADEEVRRIRSFLEDGGTLVVAADFDLQANQLLGALGARSRFDGRLLRDEQHNYRSSALPTVGNVSDPAFVAVGQVTFNHGTAVDPNGAEVLVTASPLSYLDTNRNGTLDPAEPLRAHPVVTAERIENGRVILIGDPSVFLNAMFSRSGNRVFVQSFLTRYDRVLLDYSHTRDLPVQTRALISLRSSGPVQVGFGIVALVLVPVVLSSAADRSTSRQPVSLVRHRPPTGNGDFDRE